MASITLCRPLSVGSSGRYIPYALWLPIPPMPSILTLMVLTPFIGSVLCLVTPITLVKRVSIGISLIMYACSLVVYAGMDFSTAGVSMSHGAVIDLAVDGLNMWFVLLTTYLTPIVLLASYDSIRSHVRGFASAQLLISGLLLCVFTVTDVLSFYVAFEAVLIPLFITVGVWSTSESRLRSAYLLFLFTLAGSLFMLMSLVVVYTNVGVGTYDVLQTLDLDSQSVVWLGLVAAFATKTPMVPLHMWLPRAHADAPLASSMVLAGTVLKMATYGYLRLCLQAMPTMSMYWSPLVQSMACVSLVYASLATIRQTDVKALIAYSSIGHMAVVVVGLFSGTVTGLVGAVMLGLAHGVVSPALFVLTGGVLYDRFHTRSIYYYRGIGTYMPIWSSLLLLALVCNMGVPLTLNWLGEYLTLAGLFAHTSLPLVLVACLGIVLSACYSMWLYVRMVGGSYTPYLTVATDMTRREYTVVVYLLAPAVLLGVYSEPLSQSLSPTLATLAW